MFKVIKESNRMTPIDIKEIGMTQFILTSKLWKCATGTFTMTFSWKGMKRVPTVKLFWYNHSKKQFLLAQILFIFLTMLKWCFSLPSLQNEWKCLSSWLWTNIDTVRSGRRSSWTSSERLMYAQFTSCVQERSCCLRNC